MEIKCPTCKGQGGVRDDDGKYICQCQGHGVIQKELFDMTLAQFANWMRDSKTDSDHTPANTPHFNPKSEVFCAQKSAFVNGHEIRFTANMSSFDFDTQTFKDEQTLSITTCKVDGKEVDDNFYFTLVVTNAWGKDDERAYKLKDYQCTPTNTLWEALIDVYQKRLYDDKERANKIYSNQIEELHKIGMEQE